MESTDIKSFDSETDTMTTIEQKLDATLHLVDQLKEEKEKPSLDSIETMKVQLQTLSEQQEALRQATKGDFLEEPINYPPPFSSTSTSTSISPPSSLFTNSHPKATLSSMTFNTSVIQRDQMVDQILNDLEKVYQHELKRVKSVNEKIQHQQKTLKIENEELKKSLTTLRRELELSMQEELTKLLEKIRDLENANSDITKPPFQPLSEEQIRNLQQQTTEQHIYIHQLEAEIVDLRAGRTDLEMEHSNTLRALQRQVNDLSTQCDTLSIAKSDLSQQLGHFQEELHTFVMKNKDLQQQNTQLQLEVNEYKNKLEEQTHSLQQQLFQVQSQFTLSDKKYEKKVKEEERHSSMLKEELSSLEQQLQITKTETQALETKYKSQCKELQKEKEDCLRKSQISKNELSDEIHQLRKELEQQRKSHSLEVEVLTKKLSDISIHSREISSEKLILVKKLEDLEAQLVLEKEHKKKVLEELKETEHRLQSTHEDLTAMRTAVSFSRPQYEEEKKKNQGLREQVSELQSALRQRQEDYAQSMEQAKNTWSRTVLELNETLENESKRNTELENFCTKLKHAAQKKMLQYKSEIQKVQDALAETKHQNEQLQLCLEAKSNMVDRENQDFSLQRQQLLAFIQKEIQEFPKYSNTL